MLTEQMGPNHMRRVLPGRHGLRAVPERRRAGHAVDGHVQHRQLVDGRADARLSNSDGEQRRQDAVQLHGSQRGPVDVFGRLQAVPADVRRVADVGVRDGVRLVLLDVADRVGAAVELQAGAGERVHAQAGV